MGETAKYTDKMSVRHILIVISGIMITFGCSALCFSTWGLFQPVVAEGLGVEVTVKVYPDTVHGFIPHFMPHWREAAALIVKAIKTTSL